MTGVCLLPGSGSVCSVCVHLAPTACPCLPAAGCSLCTTPPCSPLTPTTNPIWCCTLPSLPSGPAGPKPWELVPRISCPILVAWGDSDPFTPLDGPVGQYFLKQAVDRPGTEVRGAVHAVQAAHTEGLHVQECNAQGQAQALGLPQQCFDTGLLQATG